MRKLCKITGPGEQHWRTIDAAPAGHGEQGAPLKGTRWRPYHKQKGGGPRCHLQEQLHVCCVMGNCRSLSTSSWKMVLGKFISSISSYWKVTQMCPGHIPATACLCSVGSGAFLHRCHSHRLGLNVCLRTTTLHPTKALAIQRTHGWTWRASLRINQDCKAPGQSPS